MQTTSWWSRLQDRQLYLAYRAGLVMLAGIYAVLGLLIGSDPETSGSDPALPADAAQPPR